MGRFLADENMPRAVVTALSGLGHDVSWVRIQAPGISDLDVLDRAVREGRVIVTFDKDFGEIAANARLPGPCGVILIRLPMQPPVAISVKIAAVIDSRNDWPGHFSVIEPDRVRMRALRQASDDHRQYTDRR